MTWVRGVALIGLVALAVLAAPAVSGQSSSRNPNPDLDLRLDLFGPGASSIGASVRDLEDSEAKEGGGVYVASVRPDSPAAKAGFQQADVVTRFDGENVRSARQFSRLVRETPPGRTVRASVRREGRATEMSVTPEARSNAGVFVDGDAFRGRIPFDLDLDLNFEAGLMGRSRLGVRVEELTPQLATYFGAKDGVLISSVAEDSAASRAGLRAGDVIISVNGQSVVSSRDLVRRLRDVAPDTDVTIGIVRDKMESSVKTRIEDLRTRRPGRPVRPVRVTPA